MSAEKETSGSVGLVPKWAGQFDSFQHWVYKATRYLADARGSMGQRLPPMCVDALGRRCHIGADFMRARDEGTFPVRFFWECEPATPPSQERANRASPHAEKIQGAEAPATTP